MTTCETRAPRWLELIAEWRKRRRDRRVGRVYFDEDDRAFTLPPSEYSEATS